MITLSPRARRQLDELSRHYIGLGREPAVDRLIDSLELASRRYQLGHGPLHDAPRPYPTFLRPGWKWIKEGRYWIAFGPTKAGPVIRAIFYETANIPGRL